MQNKTKKYNSQTGCYKIDLFINGKYECSTAQSKTCKQAKERYKTLHPLENGQVLTAFFDYQ